MHCPTCGRENQRKQFCVYCGNALVVSAGDLFAMGDPHHRPTLETPMAAAPCRVPSPSHSDAALAAGLSHDNLPVLKEDAEGTTDHGMRGVVSDVSVPAAFDFDAQHAISHLDQRSELQFFAHEEPAEDVMEDAKGPIVAPQDSHDELQEILARITEKERLASMSMGDVVSEPIVECGGPSMELGAYSLGDSGVHDDGAFSLGDDDELGEDSGPVPLPPEAFDAGGRRWRLPSFAMRVASPELFRRAADAVQVGGQRVRAMIRGRRRQTVDRRRQGVIAIIAAIAVIGLGYAIFSGEGAPAPVEAATTPAAVETPQMAAAAQRQESNPGYELVRLSDGPDLPVYDEMDDPVPAAAPASAPARSNKARTLANTENALGANPGQAEKMKLKRPCILREGPASRFKLVRQLDQGTQISVLTQSIPDWTFTSQGNFHGWAKDCQGSQCALRLGPGEQFKVAEGGVSNARPTGRVISSGNWRYVQSGDLFGWVGPACFK